MKKLLKTACSRSHYIFLFLFSIVASLFFTLAGQLEMFSLGVITKKGPDFFELFAPEKEGTLTSCAKVSHAEMEQRFYEIDSTNSGFITKENAQNFLSTHAAPDIVSRALHYINSLIPIEKSVWTLIIALVFVALFKAITLYFLSHGNKAPCHPHQPRPQRRIFYPPPMSSYELLSKPQYWKPFFKSGNGCDDDC